MFFLISPQKNMYWYPLEASCQGTSNEYHNIFFVEKKEKYQYFFAEKAPYLELWSTFNFKTTPQIRPLLGSTKGGLNSSILLYLLYLNSSGNGGMYSKL